ncbi:hypothetical protein EON80_02975 [bacterium]|nr:MAG: hypothetical protein EON80_02975 [bacterium]
MFHLLKRHPFPVSAHFDGTFVLTFALPAPVLQPLLRPGLELDRYGDFGFVAIALVQTRDLRPAFLPPILGQSFFLSGYRIFTRYTTQQGRHLRGLQILRSDTDKPLMKIAGNLLTHYNYKLARVNFEKSGSQLKVDIVTPSAEADLRVVADLNEAPLPQGSPFPDLETARQYAGPLPYTFDYEAATHSLILIKGVRKKWGPRPVYARVEKCTFFDAPAFQGAEPILANAFYLEDVPYRWEKGRREILKTEIPS